MASVVTNKTLNTGTVTDRALPANGLTWDQATMDWNDANFTWDGTSTVTNKSLNTGSVTNKTLS